MVPAAYVLLESLPLTLSGKLDRRALPAPEQDAYATRGYEPPRGDTETALAAIWAEILHLENIGRYDNFFDLGGHSLMAVRVATRIRQIFQLDIQIDDLFQQTTIASLAEVIINIQLRQFDISDIEKLIRTNVSLQ
jgi:acyl carrier protein